MPHFSTEYYVYYSREPAPAGNSSDSVSDGTHKEADAFVFARSTEARVDDRDSSDDEILLIESSAVSNLNSFDDPTDNAADGVGGTDIPDCIIWNIDGAEATLTF